MIPKQLSVRFSAFYLALFFAVAVVSQLFSFERFPEIIASYDLPFDMSASLVIAAALVSCEVLAIPFLLFMKLSPLMRITSVVCGLLALLFWLSVGLWLCSTPNTIQNAGLFGSSIPVPEGWWHVIYITALTVLYIFVLAGRKHPSRK